MRRYVSIAIALAVVSPSLALGDEVTHLFNGKDLTGWTTFIAHEDKSDAREDPNSVFRVEDGVIHVSGKEFGCLTTDRSFENYRLVLEFKWGEKRYPPREKDKRDSGVLVHCVGPDKVWTKSIECQIQEGDCGDFHLVSGTAITVDDKRETGYHQKTKDAEKPRGEWNKVEVICDGGTITNIINGEIVNRGTDASETKGRILLQSEGAEVFYRNVDLHPLPEK